MLKAEMRTLLRILFVAAAGALAFSLVEAQSFTSYTLPTGDLLSEAGPTFRIAQTNVFTLIAYGDQRFTDPANVQVTDPRVRQYLVAQIAAEHPAAVLLSGDIPYAGDNAGDYAVFGQESKPWRDAGLRVFPALGNHEFHGDPRLALEHWWTAFPELRNRRWYSAQAGSRVYIVALDSDASLMPEGDQMKWLRRQIDGLPASIDFVLIAMHHPPVADVQTHLLIDHNPRPNEIALRDYLSQAAIGAHARFLVIAGHIHNYERTNYEDVTYLVSGGGGAQPYYVERTAADLYRSLLFPNYHYVRLTLGKDSLRGEMYRVADPEAKVLSIELKDSFDIPARPR